MFIRVFVVEQAAGMAFSTIFCLTTTNKWQLKFFRTAAFGRNRPVAVRPVSTRSGHLALFMVSRRIESEATLRQLFHPPGKV